MTRLRTYSPMSRIRRRAAKDAARSSPLTEALLDWSAVYRDVDERSDGRCEVVLNEDRCRKRAQDHHHLVKPRTSHHRPELIAHVCREHHDRAEWPYARGRLVFIDLTARGWICAIRYAKDKFAARGTTA